VALLRPPLEALGQLIAPLNDGELRVARALASQLDDSWAVYIQPRLEFDVPDFVAAHDDYGVCAIEVKDWAYNKYKLAPNGTVQYLNGNGWNPTDENPRYQAYRYRSTIFEQFFAMPGDGGSTTPSVRAIALILNHSTKHAQAIFANEAAPGPQKSIAIHGEDELHSIEQLLIGPSPAAPQPLSLERFRRHLAVSSVMSELGSPQILSEGARNIEANRNNAKMRRVRGPAGCGKSFGLAARAARLASEGKSVLVLSFNSTLAHYLRALVSSHCSSYAANPTRVTCVHFHALCKRVAEDAERRGMDLEVSAGTKPYNANIAKARSAFEQGFRYQFDAVLVDEGQDFTHEWWNMLRHHVLAPNGEMLLVSDPTQDLYENRSWTDEDSMPGAGFSGPWADLQGSYRLPPDMVSIASGFAERYLTGDQVSASIPIDRMEISGRSARTERAWQNINKAEDLGSSVGEAAADLLEAHPEICPSDLVFLCETHEQGLAAVQVLESRDHAVHHMFAGNQWEQQRRKARFWPDAPGIKGCTIHSFKGWESRAVVMGIGSTKKSGRLAYVAMTRLKSDGLGKSSHVVVVNANSLLDSFAELFVRAPESWPPPAAATRIA
jgi:hypothetical protein